MHTQQTSSTPHPQSSWNLEHAGDVDGLTASSECWASVDQATARWLSVSPGAHVLDVGCGAGGMTALLAQAAGATGRIAAVDRVPELLAVTAARVAGAVGAAPLTTHQADLRSLPFDNGSFDLVWCSRVLHGIPDQVAGASELRRVLRPGGRLALCEGGLDLRMLPPLADADAPGLESRVEAARTQWFAAWRASLPGAVAYPHGWTVLLQEAGFAVGDVRTFLLELQAPLTDTQVRHLRAALRGPLANADIGRFVAPDDLRALATLTDPMSPRDVFSRTDLHVLGASSVYVGRA